MAERLEFVVGFRGDFTGEEEDALQRAGFGVHRHGVQTSDAWWVGPDDPRAVEWTSRHVVTHVEAKDRDSALQPVRDAVGRDLVDPVVYP